MSTKLLTVSHRGRTAKLKVQAGSSAADIRRAIWNRLAIPHDEVLLTQDSEGREVALDASLPSGNYKLVGLQEVESKGESKVNPPLVFALNGQRIEIDADKVDPTVTVNDYLRYQTDFKGTKLSCGEGGCGACAVNLAKYDKDSGRVLFASANSCLRPLASLDGWSLTTTEGIGGVLNKNGFHPVQERIAEFSGLQCGFCTPGMVMTVYSGLKRDQSRENKGLSQLEIEDLFDGNLCRCTGYRPILQAAKTFAIDGDEIKDELSHAETRIKKYDPSLDPEFPSFLKTHSFQQLKFQGSGITWYRPTTFSQLFSVLSEVKSSVRLVISNTSVGIYKEQKEEVLVDISQIKELNVIAKDEKGVTVGGAVSLNDLIDTLKASIRDQKDSNKVVSFEPVIKHIYRIANFHVRNVGSVAGNLVLAKTKGFLSDLAPILVGAEARVTVRTSTTSRTTSLEEFLSSPEIKTGEVLESVFIPYTTNGDVFRTYKAAIRPMNSHAFINAAFKFNVENGKVNRAVLVYHGVQEEDVPGSRPVRASQTEKLLQGATLDNDTLKKAIASLTKEVVPTGESAQYHHRLVTGFFFKFFINIIKDQTSPKIKSASENLSLGPSNGGKLEFKYSQESAPVYLPIPRSRGAALASGETPYTGDLKLPSNTLFGAYVVTKQAAGKIKAVDTTKALKAKGAFGYISAADYPGSIHANFPGSHAPLSVNFVKDGEINFYGQPIGLIVADTTRHAEAAAKLVEVTYEAGEPGITVDEVKIIDGSHNKRGDADDRLKKDELYAKGDFFFGTQQHFALEPHQAYAVPEDDGIIVYNSLQWPDAVHCALAAALNLPMHKIRVVFKRAGGGFGGKITQNIQHACNAGVAAYKLRRPVAIFLNRNIDMAISGGRHDVKYNYEVAFNKQGDISALKALGILNGGYCQDFTWFIHSATASSADECYYIPNWDMKTQVGFTNLPTRTAVRAPGEIQGSFMIESIIEHVSAVSGVPSQVIRERNFYSDDEKKKDLLVTPNNVPITHYTAPKMWAQLKKTANIEARYKAIDKFNAENRWKKRGLAMAPVRYAMTVFQKAALVNIYSDGSILITQGGSEIGQGLYVKVAQVASAHFGQLLGKPLPLDLIRFVDTDTSIIPNATFTGGSTASEGACVAVMRAIEILNERLKPVLEGLEKKRNEKKEEGEITWAALIGQARAESIDLSAQAQWAGRFQAHEPDSLLYNNYGVGASEVEVDILTGEVNILQTDILYDCGKSLNPAVDIGQAEGAFIMGVGCLLREKVVFQPEGKDKGKLISEGTWKYKLPGIKDVPKIFNVGFYENTTFTKGILSSKSSGEPPLVLAITVHTALRYALRSARRDAGLDEWFRLDTPSLPEDIVRAAGVDPSQFTSK